VVFGTVIGQITQDLEAGKKAEQLTRTEEKTMQKAEAFFETARIRVNESSGSKEAVYEEVKAQFEAEAERLEEQTEEAAGMLCLRFWKLHLERARRWWHLLQN
jgi:hypothetical protein